MDKHFELLMVSEELRIRMSDPEAVDRYERKLAQQARDYKWVLKQLTIRRKYVNNRNRR